ncbi:TetR/AcrR family transcriptional regulator [Streptomyces varsoviensis]
MAAAKASPRERYRDQVRTEIKEHAWQQIADSGASGLSLNAIAKQMGMSGPALYRYFAGRDELITALIRDAYRGFADAVVASQESGPDLAALAHAMRDWALADPQRYFLIYGTPVPGYHAPDDVTAIAEEVMTAILDAGGPAPEHPATELDTHLAGRRQWVREHPAPPAALSRALRTWTRLHGVLSLELAGHFTGMGLDPAVLFDAELKGLTTA